MKNIITNNLRLAQKDNVMQSKKTLKQRALILGGGGALGAYQVGVLKTLRKRLSREDREKGNNNRPLFDIVAGTSIGAMNGAVLVSEYLKTRNWEDAIDQLEQFWTHEEKGLASTLSNQALEGTYGWKEWHEASKKKTSTSKVASVEAARRYYSVKYYILNGAPKVHKPLKPRDDLRFFDDNFYKWYIHSSELLKETILKFAERPIATSYEKNEPRLLVFAVDVAEGETVTFDSYAKADGSRKSEYGKYTKERGSENVIKYDDGVNIDHVMASGTLPEFYDYKDIDEHKFWDGGLLSNTPFREVLQAYHEYWTDVVPHTRKVNNIGVPELEVYIVNLHPSKQNDLPTDYDGVKDRKNDIIFGDRSSHYDENQAHLVGDLEDFVTQMKNLSTEAISKLSEGLDKDELNKKLEKILATPITPSRIFEGQQGTYDDLLKRYYRLTKVFRIERRKYDDSIYGKTGDFTAQTIQELINEGMDDAIHASLIS
jgi:NTE family protein